MSAVILVVFEPPLEKRSTHTKRNVIRVGRIADQTRPLGETDGRLHPEDVSARIQRTDVEVFSSGSVRNLIRAGRKWLELCPGGGERSGNRVALEPKTNVLKVWVVSREERVDVSVQTVTASRTGRDQLGD